VLLDRAAQQFFLVFWMMPGEGLEKLADFHLEDDDDSGGFLGLDEKVGVCIEQVVFEDASGIEIAFDDSRS
jgi:hypothetical protein